jgi:alpha-tubulin suppressor-like RCC1 family protein
MRRLANHPQRKWLRQNVVIFAIMTAVLAGMSVAYAAMSSTLQLKGQAMVKQTAAVRISNVQPVSPSASCGLANYPPTWSDNRFQVDGLLPNLNCTLKFNITVTNDSNELLYVSKITEDAFNNSAAMRYNFSIVPSTEQAVVMAHQSLTFTLEFSYRPEQTTLPSQTDFTAAFSMIFAKNTPPVLAARNSSRNFEIFRGNTNVTPASLTARLAALDDLDGDITAQITRTCATGGQAVACPNAWANWARGSYAITYNVTNSLGLSAPPITMNVNLWDFVKVEGGEDHTMALSSHGMVWIWGAGGSGRIGAGAGITTNQLWPAYRSNLTGSNLNSPVRRMVDIAANYTSSYAVDEDGSLWVWGSGSNYALGNGSTSAVYVPTKVTLPNGAKAVQVSGFRYTGMVRTTSGEVYAWGDRSNGANASSSTLQTPTKITTLPAVKYISVGYHSGAAIDMNGELWTWGRNNHGQLGAGFTGSGTAPNGVRVASSNNLPSKYSGFKDVKKVVVAESHVVLLLENGDAYIWGNNYYGRLCNGTSSTNSYSPFVAFYDVADIAVHTNSSHFLTSDGQALSCGGNSYGEIQTGSISPTAVTSPSANYQFDSDITDITANTSTSHILLNNIEVWGYGNSEAGQVGYGSTANSPSGRRWDFSVPPIVEW